MALSDAGIAAADFTDNAFSDFGQTVTHVPVTLTENFKGNTVAVFSGTASVTAVFHVRKNEFVRDKDGVRQLAPAYLMYRISESIKRGDKIIVGTGTGSVWKVDNPINRRDVYMYTDLYLWE